MGTFFVYILKSSVCLAGFYLFYRLLLSRETFHRFNRIALLALLLLSLCLPFIQFTTSQHTEVHQTMLTIEQLLMMADATAVVPQEQEITVSGIQILLMIYLAGILFFTVRNLYSLTSLLMLLKSGRKEKIEHGITLVVHEKQIAPFSWMKYIVISRTDLEENGREILIHEMAHIRNRHSIDLLIADICIFFQWFNPASWLLKQELQNIHEYEADETVIKEGVNAKEYQLLLIKKAVGTRLYSMANSFNHSKLKKRITMMIKKKSNPWARMKYAYVLPLAAVAVVAFARPEFSNKMEEISAVKVNDLKEIVETKVLENQSSSPVLVKEKPLMAVSDTTKKKKTAEDPVFMVVEEMPEYPGGLNACMQFIARNIKYPVLASEAKVEGRVIVQFVVDKDGSIVEQRVARSVEPSLDAEALRVVSMMPKWKPGKQKGQNVRVQFAMPVTFRLEGGGAPQNHASAVAVRLNDSQPTPLIIVDGKEISNAVLQSIDPENIESISVLKDESATKIYGEKGKNGVILVTLKVKEAPIVTGAKQFDEVVVVGYGSHASKTGSDQPKDVVKITGTVKDEVGKPVIGASVIIVGTTTGTITDADGRFVISAPKNSKLLISSIGLESVNVEAGTNGVINTVLKKK